MKITIFAPTTQKFNMKNSYTRNVWKFSKNDQKIKNPPDIDLLTKNFHTVTGREYVKVNIMLHMPIVNLSANGQPYI